MTTLPPRCASIIYFTRLSGGSYLPPTARRLCALSLISSLRHQARGLFPLQIITMPIYEYECPKCGTVFEEWGKATESHQEEPCPKCGTLSPRVISRTSFVLKGDGWYVSDYGYRKGITEDGGAATQAPAVAADTKPAVKKSEVPATQPEKAAPPSAARTAETKAAAKPATATQP